jgi:hypothetical protein
MKQPKLNNLVIDHKGTSIMRARLKKAKTIKITINIDQDSLAFLQKRSRQFHIPYLHLLNQALTSQRTQATSRLDRIERELKKLKRRIAA